MTGTIPDLFERTVAEVPERVWLRHEDAAYTYAQAREQVLRAASNLAAAGARPGEPVIATMRNTPGYVFTWLAAQYLGAILVTANPASSAPELEGLMAQARPRILVCDAAAAELDEAGPGGLVRVGVERLFDGSPSAPPPGASRIRPDDPAVLIPTSGTTGRSKLVTQTHRAYVMAGEGFPWWMGLGAEDRLMTSLPLFHINAPAYTMLGSIAARAGFVLLPRFSASGFIDSARRHGATEFNAIGAMLEMLMRQPERPDDAHNPLRLCYTGPAPPRERQLEMERRFAITIVCGYAMSETPYGTIWRHGERPYGTLGSVRQHPTLGQVNEARVMSDDGPVGVGGLGELQLRNPAVMKGYWEMPDETAEVLLPDGWLRTGDLVTPNADGTYTFVGRRKEVIRRRGENVAPVEIEQALEAHPAVLEAAVVGVPSELSEEEIKGFVVVADPETADLDDIRRAAAERLTRFKVPRYLEAVNGLPHTPTGRVAKHELSRDRTPREADFDTPRTPAAG